MKKFMLATVLMFPFSHLLASPLKNCQFKTEDLRNDQVFCQYEADISDPIYTQVCGMTTNGCTDNDGQNYDCTTCDYEYSGEKVVGKFIANFSINQNQTIHPKTTLEMSFDKKDITQSIVGERTDFLYSADLSQLKVESNECTDDDEDCTNPFIIKKVSGVVTIKETDLSVTNKAFHDSFLTMDFNTLTKEIRIPYNQRADLERINMRMSYVKRRGIGYQYKDSHWLIRRKNLNASNFIFAETNDGSKFLSMNLLDLLKAQKVKKLPKKDQLVAIVVTNQIPKLENVFSLEKYELRRELIWERK
ncbi:MAG: hypothetical protein ACOYL6_16135 [Bacteriovoracaceae bacterium]